MNDLELEENHVQNLMNAINHSIKDDKWTETLDLQTFFFRFTLDSATEFLFGESVDSQITLAPGYKAIQSSGPVPLDFATAFDKAQLGLAVSRPISCESWKVLRC